MLKYLVILITENTTSLVDWGLIKIGPSTLYYIKIIQSKLEANCVCSWQVPDLADMKLNCKSQIQKRNNDYGVQANHIIYY